MIPNPIVALLFAALGVVAVVVFVHPRRGVLARVRRARRSEERVVAEDVLKLLYARIEADDATSLADLIALQRKDGVSGSRAIEHLRRDGLITIDDGGVQLTRRGAAIAADLVRAHRLWELHLAEETGYDQREWHGRADAMEHQLGGEAVDRLARRLGSPVLDPDGDPIPAADGTPPRQANGQPIVAVEADSWYRITHLEDEPQELYADLIDRGLYYGMRFRLVLRSESKFLIESDGRTIDIPLVLAAGISVERCDEPEVNALLLSDVRVGERVEVLGITAQGRGAERQRFLDLGFVPGATVAVEFRSAGKDPTAYRVKSSLVALRREQAAKIRVKPSIVEEVVHG